MTTALIRIYVLLFLLVKLSTQCVTHVIVGGTTHSSTNVWFRTTGNALTIQYVHVLFLSAHSIGCSLSSVDRSTEAAVKKSMFLLKTSTTLQVLLVL